MQHNTHLAIAFICIPAIPTMAERFSYLASVKHKNRVLAAERCGADLSERHLRVSKFHSKTLENDKTGCGEKIGANTGYEMG